MLHCKINGLSMLKSTDSTLILTENPAENMSLEEIDNLHTM